MEPRPRWISGTLFAALIGCAGWALLALASSHAGAFDQLPPGRLWVHAVLFLAFGLAARGLAFPLRDGLHLSIDTPFHIAGALVMGIVPGAWIFAISAIPHAAIRIARARAEVPPAARRPKAYELAYLLYAGGLPALLLLTLGSVLEVDARLSAAAVGLDPALWLAPALALPFLLLHYLAMGFSLHLRGVSFRDAVSDMIVPGVLVELSLVPLCITLSVAGRGDLQSQVPVNVLCLGITLLAINWAARRLALTRRAMEERMRELEALVNVGRAISASLDVEELCDRLQREISHVIEGIDLFALALRKEDCETFRFRIYRASRQGEIEGGRHEELEVGSLTGPHGWVVAHRTALRLEDLAAEVASFGPAQLIGNEPTRAWMGAPLELTGDVAGVVSVQSARPGAFTEDHLRMLDSMARQAAVAVENARLFRMATEDGLTGLYVRRYFERRLEEEWRRQDRQQTPFAVVVLDLDGMKAVNDRLGHAAGDRVLSAIGRALRATVREVDIPARVGGDEIAVLLSGADAAEALRVAERLCVRVASTKASYEGTTVQVTASLGVAHHPDSGASDPGSLMVLADAALYRAKSAGGNRVESALPGPSSTIRP